MKVLISLIIACLCFAVFPVHAEESAKAPTAEWTYGQLLEEIVRLAKRDGEEKLEELSQDLAPYLEKTKAWTVEKAKQFWDFAIEVKKKYDNSEYQPYIKALKEKLKEDLEEKSGQIWAQVKKVIEEWGKAEKEKSKED